MTPAQDEDLLNRIRNDRQQFGVLFDQYYAPIFGYLFRRTGEYDLARDMAAETFLKAFLKIEDYVWKGVPLSAWLYKIATNEANQYFRKKKYRPLRLGCILDYESLVPTDSEADRAALEKELDDHRDFTKILGHLKSLDSRYQDVIALRYFENKNIREIGEILEKPEGTIKSILSRGLEKLRQLILEP